MNSIKSCIRKNNIYQQNKVSCEVIRLTYLISIAEKGHQKLPKGK